MADAIEEPEEPEPVWLDPLIKALSGCYGTEHILACTGEDGLAPAHVPIQAAVDFAPDLGWTIQVFPAAFKLVHGAEDDDDVTSPPVTVEVSALMRLFDEPPHVLWSDSTTLRIDGTFAANDVTVLVMIVPPDDVEPVGRYDAHANTWDVFVPMESLDEPSPNAN